MGVNAVQPDGETQVLKFSQFFHLVPAGQSFAVTNGEPRRSQRSMHSLISQAGWTDVIVGLVSSYLAAGEIDKV